MSSTIYRSAAGQDQIRRWCEGQLGGWPLEHERRVFQAGGLDTHILRAGGGSESVVFIAGDRFSAASCLPLLAALAQRYRVVAVDVPGQPGLSSGVADAFGGRLARYGSWLDDVIGQLATSPVVVFGHSFGGAIALAADSSDIRGKVVVSTGGLCPVEVVKFSVEARGYRWRLMRSG